MSDTHDEDTYSNIREILGHLIGRTVVDVTQHDQDEFEEDGSCYVQVHFDDGTYVKFPLGDDGFDHNCPDDDDTTTDSDHD